MDCLRLKVVPALTIFLLFFTISHTAAAESAVVIPLFSSHKSVATGTAISGKSTDGIGVFGYSENGEVAYLSSGSGGMLTGYRESEDFGASENGVSFGRYQKSDGTFNFVAMEYTTFDAANTSPPKVGPIVINEIIRTNKYFFIFRIYICK